MPLPYLTVFLDCYQLLFTLIGDAIFTSVTVKLSGAANGWAARIGWQKTLCNYWRKQIGPVLGTGIRVVNGVVEKGSNAIAWTRGQFTFNINKLLAKMV